MDDPAPLPAPEVVALRVAEAPAAWAGAGFTVDADGRCRVGGVVLELVGGRDGDVGDGDLDRAGPPTGVVGWSLRHLPEGAAADLDGFPTTASDEPAGRPMGVPPGDPLDEPPNEPADEPPDEPGDTPGEAAGEVDRHPNGVTRVDHIVLLTDDLARTVEGAARVGLTPRRWRDHALPDGTPVRQAFFVVGELVLELVAPTERPRHPRPGVRSFGLAFVCPDLARARAALGPHLGTDRPAVQPGRRIATVRHRDLGLSTPIALMTPRP